MQIGYLKKVVATENRYGSYTVQIPSKYASIERPLSNFTDMSKMRGR